MTSCVHVVHDQNLELREKNFWNVRYLDSENEIQS